MMRRMGKTEVRGQPSTQSYAVPRRTEDTPVEHPGRGPGSTGQGGQRSEDRRQKKMRREEGKKVRR